MITIIHLPRRRQALSETKARASTYFTVSRQVLGCPIPPLTVSASVKDKGWHTHLRRTEELAPDIQELVASTECRERNKTHNGCQNLILRLTHSSGIVT